MKKIEKLVANLHDKTEYFTHTRNLKQAINHELVLKKVHKVMGFNQNAWLKPYTDMNTNLKKKQEMILKKISFKLMKKAVLGKTLENAGKHSDIFP